MKTLQKIISLLLIAALLQSATGCSQSAYNTSTSKDKEAANSTITITDDNGDKVTLPSNIEKIVVCDILPLPSVLAVFFDSAKKIVGMSDTSMSAAKNSLLSELYPEILKAQTNFINGSKVNVEELMSLKPDVVFYNSSSKELGDQLRNAGFNAVALSVNKWEYNSIETLNNWISLLDELFPNNDKAKTVESYSNKIYKLIQERVETLTDKERAHIFFLFKYSENSITTSGKKFFGEWWAKAIGAINIACELTTDNSVEVTMEQIYKWNPEIVFITNFTYAQPEDLYKKKIGTYDWSGIAAIERKQVYKMPLGMYRSYTPGVDTPITLLWLAKTVYPDLFSDIDITMEAKDYYKTVFGVELTGQQAESIFTPVSNAAKGF